MILRQANVVLLPLMLWLAGCATSPFPPQASDRHEGVLQLAKPLTIDAGHARVFIQAGQVVAQPSHHDAVCVIESWQVSDQVQMVTPDQFRVASMQYRRGDVHAGFGVFGSTDLGVGFQFGLGGFGQPMYPMAGRFHELPRLLQGAVIMRLVSEKQPLIYQLTCFSATGWAPFVEPPTPAQMQETLGDVATLVLGHL
jgi:hypothetical protein